MICVLNYILSQMEIGLGVKRLLCLWRIKRHFSQNKHYIQMYYKYTQTQIIKVCQGCVLKRTVVHISTLPTLPSCTTSQKVDLHELDQQTSLPSGFWLGLVNGKQPQNIRIKKESKVSIVIYSFFFFSSGPLKMGYIPLSMVTAPVIWPSLFEVY